MEAVRKAFFLVAIALAAILIVKDPRSGISVMTAVTVVKRRTAIMGNRKVKTFTMTGNNAYTLDTRLKTIEVACIDPNVANAPTVLTESTVGGYQTITFTAGGAFTAAKLVVIGN